MQNDPARPGPPIAGPGPFRRPEDWLAVGIVGLVVFLVGIYMPATRWIHFGYYYGTSFVAVGIALGGGIIAGLGFSKWYDLRPEGPAARRRPPTRVDMSRASNLSSFEVYRPPSEGGPPSKKPKV